MKAEVYQALKEFEQRFQESFPEATFQLTDPYDDDDAAIDVFLHTKAVTYEDRMKLAEIGTDIEEKYDVCIATLMHAQAT